ncbi:MAG: LCP family protein [Anaerorhabdus sp.]
MTNKKKGNARIGRDMTKINIAYVIGAIIANALLILTVYNVTRYSALSKEIFIIINVVVLLLLVILNLGLAMMIRTKKVSYLSGVSVVLVLSLLIGGYGTYATSSLNNSISAITSVGGEKEEIETSFVVSGSSSVASTTDMSGKMVGYVAGTQSAILGKSEIVAQGIDVEYTEYESSVDLALALFSEEVEVAILPSNYVAQLEVNEGLIEDLDKSVVIHTFSETVELEAIAGANKDITSEPFTVLILGVDEGRSDAIMVASVNPISMNVTLTSIARDSYVPIACYSGEASDKIGHARAVSTDCTINTVENLLDIEIDYYFESNFQGIVDIVDALGGITVYNETEFVGQTSSSTRGIMQVWVPGGGYVYLNGEQSLAFARERHLYASGDFQRQANQQQVIVAILREVMRSQDIDKVLAMLATLGKNVSTNLRTDQLISFFNYTLKKTARFYDTEHYERVFNISSSRIIGYDSGLWNDTTQTSIYIYRLYNGSIEDTREAILRNITLTSTIDSTKKIRWNANWTYAIPTIGQTSYDEAKIAAEVPSELGNFVGLQIGRLQSWAKVFGIQVNIRYVGEGMDGFSGALSDGTIISYDIPSGTDASAFSVINVNVIQRGAEATEVECEDGKVYDEETGACVVDGYSVTVIYVNKTTGEEITSLRYADVFDTDETYSISVQKENYDTVSKSDITVEGITSTNPFTLASGKISGKVLESNLTFTIKVTPTTTAATYTLTIKYVDSTGAALMSDKTVSLAAGASYTVEAPAVEGYTFAQYTGTTNGSSVTMGSGNMTVSVKYTKNPVVPTPTPSPTETPTSSITPTPNGE